MTQESQESQESENQYMDKEWPDGVIILKGVDKSSIAIPIDEIAAVSGYRSVVTIHFKAYNNFLSVVMAEGSEDWDFVASVVEDIGHEIADYKERKRRDRL